LWVGVGLENSDDLAIKVKKNFERSGAIRQKERNENHFKGNSETASGKKSRKDVRVTYTQKNEEKNLRERENLIRRGKRYSKKRVKSNEYIRHETR